MKIASDIRETPPWTRAFADITLRALLKLHLDYLLWSLPQNWRTEHDPRSLAGGPGVAYADERTVCAAISQEFLMSRAVAGGWVDAVEDQNIQAGQRFFRISRETPYPCSGGAADLCVERINPETGEVIDWPTLIEAKRAFRWTNHLYERFDPKATDLKDEVVTDIQKLRNNLDILALARPARGFILVWNVYNREFKTDITPEDYLQRFADDRVKLWQVRGVPLSSDFEQPCRFDPQSRVAQWIWLALAEVTRLGPR